MRAGGGGIMQNNIGLLLTKRAYLNPDVEALVDVASGERFTFAEFNARCNQTAHLIHGLGVRRGDRVALLLMNGPAFMETFFALAKLGAVVVPLNWRLVADELAFILKDSGAETLVYGGEFAETVADLHARGADATALRNWVHVGDAGSRADFAVEYESLQAAAPTAEPEIGADEDDLLYIMYTSGTTGLPKGAVHTHASALWACITIAQTADLRYKDRYLVSLPLFHVGALTPMTGAVYGGFTTIIMRAFDPVKTWELMAEERITTMLAVPAMLNFMLQVPDVEKYDYSALRWCMSGAAPVPVTLIEQFAKLGIEIHQVYGLTETCGPACLISPDDALAKAGSTGKAFFHTDVRIVDDAGVEVPHGEAGEVIIRGKHLMTEYWNRPDATAETIKDGWLYSGDIASMDAEGFVYIQDRKKDMIISGGENVYPAEIENVILSHPQVTEVAVIGLPSAKWGETPLAIVVRSDPALGAQDVLAHCDGKLSRFKQPKAVEFIDEIPRNPTGKILKRILREQFPGPAAD